MNSNDWCVVCNTIEKQIVFIMKEFIAKECKFTNSSFWKKIDQHFAEIKTHDLELMDKEITEAEQWDKENPSFRGRLGMECDRVEWLKFRETVRKELEKRK